MKKSQDRKTLPDRREGSEPDQAPVEPDNMNTGYAALRRAGYAHHLFAFKKVMGYRIHLMDKTAMLCACSVKK